MKRIFRIFIFSCFALFITSFWNKGFLLHTATTDFIKAAVALTILFVLIRPIMKVVFLPFNMLTFGLFSFFIYVLLLYIASSWYGFFSIKAWEFLGLHLGIITLPKIHFSYFANLVLSSFSLSSIINVLDNLT